MKDFKKIRRKSLRFGISKNCKMEENFLQK